ncbi:MAG: peptidoglycan-binding protein LysM [Sphingomonadaceae bacterium]
MGLFDFFKKDKGKEVFGENDAAEQKAEAIRREIDRLGLPGDIKVRVEGSKVKISGRVPDEETRRKLMVIAGNTRYIDQVDDDGLDGGTGGRPRTHEVEPGDTLSEIAQKYYGDANAYHRIFEANRPMLKDPDEIYPGQVLIIPEATTANV